MFKFGVCNVENITGRKNDETKSKTDETVIYHSVNWNCDFCNALSVYAFDGNRLAYTDQQVQAVQDGNSDAITVGNNMDEPGKDSAGKDGAVESGTEGKSADKDAEGKDGEGESSTEGESADKDAAGKDGEGESGAEGESADEDSIGKDDVNEYTQENAEEDDADENSEEDDTEGTTYDIAYWISDVQLFYCRDGLDGNYSRYGELYEESLYSGCGLKANVAFNVPGWNYA